MHLKPEEFIAGLFHALAIRNGGVLPYQLKPFHRAIKEVHSRLIHIASDFNVRAGFTMSINPDGRSPIAAFCLQWALKEQLVAFDDEHRWRELRYQYHAEYAPEKLEQLPGGPELYLDLADWFLSHYSAMETATPQPSS